VVESRIGARSRPDLGHDLHDTHPHHRCALRVCFGSTSGYIRKHFLTTAIFNPGAHAPPLSLLRYRALCSGTGTVPVGSVLMLGYRVADHLTPQTPFSSDMQKSSLTIPLLRVLSPVTGLLLCAAPLLHCTGRHDLLTAPHRPDVAAGTYVLSVVSRDHVFDQVRTIPFVLFFYVPVTCRARSSASTSLQRMIPLPKFPLTTSAHPLTHVLPLSFSTPSNSFRGRERATSSRTSRSTLCRCSRIL
jgi:hypothetical protein